MLDEKTLKVMEFLYAHPNEYFSVEEMCSHGIPADFETLQWMEKNGLALRSESDDPDERALEHALGEITYFYSLSTGGRITLSKHNQSIRAERRANLAIAISVVSLLVSAFTAWKG